MSDLAKVKPAHTHRAAVIYVRQSSASQVERHRESTERQYALVHRAIELGWHREQVIIVDEDQGLSGSGIAKRAGFAQMAADVALAKVGLVLGLEVSRLARNNADWYRLLDLCGMTDTLIGDPPRPRTQGHHERGRAARPARAAQRGHSQQSRAGRPAPRPAGGPPLGREGGRGPVPSQRGRHQRDPRGLRTLCGAGVGPPSLAVVSCRGLVVPVAGQRRTRHPLGGPDLYGHPQSPREPGVCWRLRLWEDPLRALRRYRRHDPAAHSPPATRRMGGADSRSSRGLH